MKKHAATRSATLRSRLSIIERAAKHAGDTAVMTFIETVPPRRGLGRSSPRCTRPTAQVFGHVPNLTQAFSLRPDVYAAWRAAQRRDQGQHGPAPLRARHRRRGAPAALELLHARARVGPRSTSSSTPDEPCARSSTDHRAAGLDAVDVAVMDLADKVADDATSVTQADVDGLRALGLTDAEILDVVLGRRGALLLQQGARRPSAPSPTRSTRSSTPPLRDALTVGARSPTRDPRPERLGSRQHEGVAPAELLEVLERSVTADYVTVDGRGQPVVLAADAALPGGGGLHRRDGRARGGRRPRRAAVLRRRGDGPRAGHARTPRTRGGDEVDVHVRPERVYVWPGGDLEAEPQLYDAHVDEVRSAHNEEPEVGHAPPEGGGSVWDERLDAPRRPPPRRRPGLRRPRRLPVRRPRPGPRRARGGPRARRRRPGRRADRARPGLPVRATRPTGAASTCSATSTRTAASGSCGPTGSPTPRTPAEGLMAGLTVAVTGPTGEIGRAFIRSLERSHEVGRIVGMARRPFDPAAHGWKRTEYRRGDVLDRASVEGLVEGADVVVHLAFVVAQGQQRDPPRQRRGLAQRLRGGRRGRARSGWSTRARSPPTGSPRTSTASSPRTCRRSATRATPTPPTRPRSRRSSTTR